MKDRQRLVILLVGMFLVILTIVLTWPSTVEDPTGGLVFGGEVSGDLMAVGAIWGEHVSQLDCVSLKHWSMGEGEGLRINVTNVSNVWLVDHSPYTNISVPCENGSFQVIADNGEFEAYLSDLAFECEYQEFTVRFLGANALYEPQFLVTSLEGHGNLVHGQNHRWDITMNDCVVVVDGVEYRGVDSLFIPEDETPYVEVRGDNGGWGNIAVWGGLQPHVNGTLEVENFLHKKDGRTQLYQRIMFEGEDIFINHTNPSESLTDRDLAVPFQLEIKVFISPDTTVWVEEAPDTPLWVEAILMVLLAILILYTITEPLRSA